MRIVLEWVGGAFICNHSACEQHTGAIEGAVSQGACCAIIIHISMKARWVMLWEVVRKEIVQGLEHVRKLKKVVDT